jgi:hypothetical protein
MVRTTKKPPRVEDSLEGFMTTTPWKWLSMAPPEGQGYVVR